MLPSIAFVISACLSSSVAKPINKIIDLDLNGVPDWCNLQPDGSYECLEQGQWDTVNSDGTVPGAVTTAVTATTTSAALTSTTTATSTTAALVLPTGRIAAVTDWVPQNGTTWSISYEGNIGFTGALAGKALGGDKCRSSKLGDKVIWNCGDMQCQGDWKVCGFAMGPAMYGTSSVMTINTDDVTNIKDNNFVEPWIGDAPPVAPQSAWGMDTSNVAPINDTHGVAYAWEIWRGAADGSYSDRGNAVSLVTLGATKPVATRVGPLLTDGSHVALGLLAIMRDGNYIYSYAVGGPSNLVVSRVAANDDVFDSTKYESLVFGSNTWQPGIPKQADNTYGMTTATTGGKFGCAVYGSVFYNNYLQKYTIICNILESNVNMYTSDTPYGPWSAEYPLLGGWHGYGSMAHPAFSPGGSHKELYFSFGPNQDFYVFKLTFH